MNNITSKILIGLTVTSLWACSDDANNDDYSALFADKYNQKMTWNPDSLAFTRADWSTNTVAGGATYGTATVEMWGGLQEVSRITYASSLLATHVTGNSDGNTLSEAVTESNPAFAINGCAADFLMIDGNIIVDKSQGGENTGALAIREDNDGEVAEIIACTPNEYSFLKDRYQTVLAGGDLLVFQGEAIDQPESQRASRTILGTTRDGSMVVLFIKTENGTGATLDEAAFIARVSGLINALCLADNSSMWFNGDTTADKGAETVIYTVLNTPFASGDGTADEPYVIENRRHIKNMLSALIENQPVYFELGADIDMAGIDNWVPLNQADPFTCPIYFDGKGHTISNFKCDYRNYPSFFGVLYGECRNVKFVNPVIDNSSNSACGVIGAYVGTVGKPGLVEQVAVVGAKVSTGASASPKMGGIAGYLREGTIRNSYCDVTLTRLKPEWNVGCGGIAGNIRENSTIEYCYATGTIDAIKYDTAGSIWGWADNNLGWKLTNNIGWMSSITAAWASNRVGGRTKYDSGNTLGTNYGRRDCSLTLFENDSPSQPYTVNYKGRIGDQSIEGVMTDDIIAAARSLGWDQSIWNLSGDMPRLVWE